MADYTALVVEEMYLDGFKRLLEFIGKNYDWNKHQHLVFIKKIGSVALTDKYKGKIGDKHQVFRDIELEIVDVLPKEKVRELNDILET
ncbi:hypothetical protein KY308_01930 [Candidatus Woesearchaeota archaeon]|nr:hypothetical protein [Candidatus Woesearchaeota archaeon]